ncbi:uncharacterized protein LOC107032126 [Solanum pennellii]|uniref:Uncharacterized protein LOC107032126 n=1 Tax=Solanum pennellii TaxID=28526 RepID=A0ABM1HR89_SOLPN|nr:uncharacterized protein LOC107032126 [Solanum pennellii]
MLSPIGYNQPTLHGFVCDHVLNREFKIIILSAMPHRARPMAGLLLFTGLNVVLVSTITPVYDFVCFHPYWERRREHRRQEREAALRSSTSAQV